ncbi:hypothetical protein VitviT2T_002166 [Vitis vinifera]|uniref:Auxin-responsive protein SAUR36 n=2 Tax=Vitis vinifera TaxID=29760 RepID=A0A438K3C1_VITVI|nr:auxin-responsive protein SAUR36 [Vitis vinifera]RVW50614.1 Auxin-responsive protein SAUR36 [Vitis vinifera]RVX15697.1 Auxin-responsive protein SAUR36 [Vitis vinifera]WJZ82402.1 hypothetical protein VitviT2T_002166 [Vitis vinifera]
MRKTKGFRLGRKLVTVFRWVFRRNQSPRVIKSLDHRSCRSRAMTKICNWGRRLRMKAKGLCFPKSGYVRVGHEPCETKPMEVPKGHLAVYVGDSGDHTHRVLVPVLYFNHPLFGELLRNAEKVYGFNHPGGITIPCPITEFEKVKTRIDAGEHFRRYRSKQRH